jgi:catechol 2,3-dioxygenase-like lactoylglutathione lyase family enzyme
MPIHATYTHTNLIAQDWRALAAFYIDVLGCIPVPPERDLSGEAVERGTCIPGAHLTGEHLRLPGCGDTGPTLEIYTYDHLADEGHKAINRPGFAHLAFRVDDLPAARELVLAGGCTAVGDAVTTPVGADRQITWCYMTDPEGNAIELQTVITQK